MKYTKAVAKVVLFDNSDVVTTSSLTLEEAWNCKTPSISGYTDGYCKNKPSYNEWMENNP